jgi:hypothetical protein
MTLPPAAARAGPTPPGPAQAAQEHPEHRGDVVADARGEEGLPHRPGVRRARGGQGGFKTMAKSVGDRQVPRLETYEGDKRMLYRGGRGGGKNTRDPPAAY